MFYPLFENDKNKLTLRSLRNSQPKPISKCPRSLFFTLPIEDSVHQPEDIEDMFTSLAVMSVVHHLVAVRVMDHLAQGRRGLYLERNNFSGDVTSTTVVKSRSNKNEQTAPLNRDGTRCCPF